MVRLFMKTDISLGEMHIIFLIINKRRGGGGGRLLDTGTLDLSVYPRRFVPLTIILLLLVLKVKKTGWGEEGFY